MALALFMMWVVTMAVFEAPAPQSGGLQVATLLVFCLCFISTMLELFKGR